MTGIVDLPDNYERHLTLGKEALARGSSLEAKDHFEGAYNLVQTFEANVFYVESLLELGQPSEALLVADELVTDYLRSEAHWALYCRLLLSSDYFIQVEKIIVSKEKSGWLTAEVSEMADVATSYFKKMSPQVRQGRLAESQHLDEDSVMGQLGTAKTLERLPKEDYVSCARQLLENEEVSLLVRQGILENLIAMAVTETVTLVDIHGQRHEIVPDEWYEDQTEKELKAVVLNELADKMAFELGELKELLSQEVNMQFKLLRPFASQWIVDKEHWVALILANYLGQEPYLETAAVPCDLQEKTMTLLRQELLSLSLG